MIATRAFLGTLLLEQDPAFSQGRGAVPNRIAHLVALEDSDGRRGLGEAAPLAEVGTESEPACRRSLAALRLVAGTPTLPPDAGPAARHAIDLATWDLLARRAGVPAASLLDPAPAASVAVHRLLLGSDPGELTTQARVAAAQGWSAVKVKVGAGLLEHDLRRLRALRDAAPGLSLRLDANGCWRDEEEALTALCALADFGPELIEQPTPGGDLALLITVARRSPVPVVADESVTDLEAAERLLEAGGCVGLVLKPLRLGGLGPAWEIATRALDRGVPVLVTTSMDGAIARAGAFHLARAVEGLAARLGLPPGWHGLDTGRFLRGDTGHGTQPTGGSWVAPPGGCGLGVVAAELRWQAPLKPRRAARGPLSPFHLVFPSGVLESAEMGRRAAQVERTIIRTQDGSAPLLVDAGDPAALAVLLLAASGVGRWVLPMDPRLSVPELDRRRLLRLQNPPEGGGLVVFTSGTTGPSRAALLPWAAVIRSADLVAARTGFQRGDHWLSALPLAHVGGLASLLRAAVRGAGAFVAPGFEADLVSRWMGTDRPTHASFVARTLERFLSTPARPSKSLRWLLVGGGPTPPPLTLRARNAGLPAAPTWGLTEAGSTVTILDPSTPPESPGDAGWALPGWSVTTAGGDEGELQLAGPSLFAGYNGEAPRTDSTPWATGDWGRINPSGRVIVLDRRSDLVVSGGENVYPAEVEAVLLRCEFVEDVVIVGLPDPSWGERVTAVVIWVGPPQAAALMSWSEQNLAPWQRIRSIRTWPGPLPRTASGKLQRAVVRSALREEDT